MFGLGWWLPELFTRFEQYEILHPNKSFTLQELASLTEVKNITCEPLFRPTVIYNTVIVAVSAVFYNAISSGLSTKLHAKTITLVSMVLGGISAGSIYLLKTSQQSLIVACVFLSTMITSNMTIAGIGVEYIPTRVSGIAVCFIMCFGRLGAVVSNVMFGTLMNTRCEIPICIVAIVVFLGGILCGLVSKDEKPHTSNALEINVSVISESWQP